MKKVVAEYNQDKLQRKLNISQLKLNIKYSIAGNEE